MTRYEQVADLMSKGMTHDDIAVALGCTTHAVRNGMNRARQKGLLPPHEKKSGYDAFACRVHNARRRIGIMRDAIAPLTDDQMTWLADETEDLGCDNVAEFICELIRDAHAVALDAKAKRG